MRPGDELKLFPLDLETQQGIDALMRAVLVACPSVATPEALVGAALLWGPEDFAWLYENAAAEWAHNSAVRVLADGRQS